MAIPQLVSRGSLEAAAPIIPNFAGPQPGTLGGGISPLAIGSLTTVTSGVLSVGTSIFVGLALIGAGQLVAVFDLPRSNDNFAAVAGIFEEENGGQRRGKREISQPIVSFAKFLIWINETLERGISKIIKYVISIIQR